MQQKVFTFLAFIILVFLLIGLNAASYVRKNIDPDSEFNPNRSTYNAGGTGTRAFFDLLAETGRKPVRWGEKISALETTAAKPRTFVIIGWLQSDYTDAEVEQLLKWVSRGGKLVVIDRDPKTDLISTTANWKISSQVLNFPNNDTDPTNQLQMTDKVSAGTPAQPTIFTANVNAVQPSLFAASIKLENFAPDKTTYIPTPTPTVENDYEDYNEPPPPPKPAPTMKGNGSGNIIVEKPAPTPPPMVVQSKDAQIQTNTFRAPVVHIAAGGKNLLVDFPYGSGQIVFLSDPYIVSNAGISLVDNAQLAINIVNANGGTIAFDEYHHGYGTSENKFFSYFADTPIISIGIQALLLVGFIFFTQSRRFARALPADEPSRLSKLEYVSAMAELQQRTKAYDLAIENIYTDFRRRTAKFFGASNYEITRRELAVLIAERLKSNADDVESLMRKAEEITYGEPTNKREVLEITSRLRELEEKLNLKRTRSQTFGK